MIPCFGHGRGPATSKALALAKVCILGAKKAMFFAKVKGAQSLAPWCCMFETKNRGVQEKWIATQNQLGCSIVMGVPQNGWFVREIL